MVDSTSETARDDTSDPASSDARDDAFDDASGDAPDGAFDDDSDGASATDSDSTVGAAPARLREAGATERTAVRNVKRARFERDEAYAILDDDFVAHVGFSVGGDPFVIPMVYGRDGDRLLLHGSVATRIMRALDDGAPACVTVTKVDGLVLARSQFHHSVNYRCVVALGTATRLRDDEARAAFDVICDHLLDGRARESREANRPEERQTMVLAFPLDELSVKVRAAPPSDDPIDLPPEGELSEVWAGVLPLRVVAGVPVADEYTSPDAVLPGALSRGDHRWA